ncbi:Myogenesis-regulating glycosidase [Pseudolycoriella hygida]|uniref:Myogenesis-regulating glycosidase n=1 Tax=Pseudolycoriella hygida TaxID=35572 RepID=A0A9Q0S7W5_9DIPT|nr:Myogenesis-regulating glycosidase [Pseudolycoriella hygida]
MTEMLLKLFCIVTSLSAISGQITTYSIGTESALDVTLRIQHQSGNDTHFSYSILRNSVVIHESEVYQNFGGVLITQTSNGGYLLRGDNSTFRFSITVDTDSFVLISIERSSTNSTIMSDCVQLKSNEMSWYGGPEQKYQYWPIEKLSLDDYAYVTKELDSCALAERYWLNSHGLFLYVEQEAPLFLTQSANQTMCLITKKVLPYYTRNGPSFTFNYNIGIGENAREAHLEAVERFLKKPTDYPDETMTRYPIWSTWAKYRRDIDENVIISYADLIRNNGFNNSQMDIDDMWETCYGSLEFDTAKFPNISHVTSTLKAKGFRVTLWVTPFINRDCEPYYSEALSKGYFVLNHNGREEVKWWNTGENMTAGHIDFTKTEAAEWYAERLRRLRASSGIDSFKFDAGETSWAPADPVLNATFDSQPNALTVAFVNTVVPFGKFIEVRTAFRQQHNPVYVRMLDKDSLWTWNNGLPTLVTTLLQFNMVGYPFVLPDMIGGNGYEDNPIVRTKNKDLYIRWLQANVFMPALQFSFVPWDFDDETIVLGRKFTSLHEQYADTIIERFNLAVRAGHPVNPPIWWIAPNDRVAQQIYDQFLLGDEILVAPVLEEGRSSRNIYLPLGQWIDQNTGQTYQGPLWLNDYPAPQDVLPYFIKGGSVRLYPLTNILAVFIALINFISYLM